MNRTYFLKLTWMIGLTLCITIISVIQVNADNFQNLESMDEATLGKTIKTLKEKLDQDKTDVTALDVSLQNRPTPFKKLFY